MTELVIPQTVQNIGYGIVGYCDELERLDIFTYIEEIPNVIATNCGKLSSVQFPNTVTRIGNGAFEESGLDGFLRLAMVLLANAKVLNLSTIKIFLRRKTIRFETV